MLPSPLHLVLDTSVIRLIRHILLFLIEIVIFSALLVVAYSCWGRSMESGANSVEGSTDIHC